MLQSVQIDTYKSKPETPEKELLVAVLDRAVLDYSGREGDLHKKAKEWIFEDNDNDSLFSYNAICDYLGINPEALRTRILELNIPKNVSQAHRWLRKKVQTGHKNSSFRI